MRTLLFCLLMPAVVASAQDNPISSFNRVAYAQLKAWVLASAEKAPEEIYSFKPVATVRSFRQIVGHVADAQYLFCSAALGEPAPDLEIEQTKTSKADLVAALKTSFAYCDKAYNAAADATAGETVKLMGRNVPRAGALNANLMHMSEHYGNLVTYLRIRGIVPPSSEPRPPQK